MNTLQEPARPGNRLAHDATSPKSRRGAAQLLVRFKLDGDPDSSVKRATGRYGWTLLQLYRVGRAGLTTLERPAPRWSHYVFELRKMGVNIETEYEPHAGDFSGTHGRYRLLSAISIVEIVEAGEVPHE